ncbi:MAG: hypothetical protein ACK5NY_06080 [Burkholderiaceae bacterium]
MPRIPTVVLASGATPPIHDSNSSDVPTNLWEKIREKCNKLFSGLLKVVQGVVLNTSGVRCYGTPVTVNLVSVDSSNKPNVQAVPIHANKICFDANSPVESTYVAAQTPDPAFLETEKLLVNAISSGQGLFQFVSPRAQNRFDVEFCGKEGVLHNMPLSSDNPILGQLLRGLRKENSPTLLLGGRYEVTSLECSDDKDEEHVSYTLAVCDRLDNNKTISVPLTQVSFGFESMVLSQTSIERANQLFENHIEKIKGETPRNLQSMIVSYAGIGRNATLIVYNRIAGMIKRGEVLDNDKLKEVLVKTIMVGREQRGPRFIHSKAQLKELYDALTTCLKDFRTQSPSMSDVSVGEADVSNGSSDSEPASRMFNPPPQVAATAPLAITAGLHNFGNTCYANAALKGIVSSMGSDLLPHLEKLKEDVDFKEPTAQPGPKERKPEYNWQERRAALNRFIKLVNGIGSSVPKEDLQLFFSELDKFDSFKEFAPITTGGQQDAVAFMSCLSDIFKLHLICSQCVRLEKEFRINPDAEEKLIAGGLSIPKPEETISSHKSAYLHCDQLISMKDSDVQEIKTWQDFFGTLSVEQECIKDWGSMGLYDIKSLSKWKIHFEKDSVARVPVSIAIFKHESNGTISYDKKLESFKLDYDTTAQVEATDDSTGKKYHLTLAARDLIMHRGTTLNSGHYVAYTRDGNGDWWLHNDSSVTKSDPNSYGGTVYWASFEITDKKPIESLGAGA